MADRMQWEKFWYRDFMDDLKICSAQTRGFWISFLSYLWGNGGIGDFTGSFEDFSRISACTILEVELSINELDIKKICEVQHPSNAIVTLINRRLKSEEIERENTRLRLIKFRKNKKETLLKRSENVIDDRRKKIEDIKDKYIYGEFKNVLLKKEEKEKVSTEEIESLSTYLASTGKRYKSHYATILNWRRKNGSPPPKKTIKITCPKCHAENIKSLIWDDGCSKCINPRDTRELTKGIGKEIK